MKTAERIAASDAGGYLVGLRGGFTVPSNLAAREGEHGVMR